MSAETTTYKIKLPQFEGPFDLLLFFIERDELDIYNIPITKVINDFLDFIHQSEADNIELSSEFILFVSTLMRIKAKMLLPRKDKDTEGNDIDPREEMVQKLLEYKKFKEVSAQLADMEALRLLATKRGNIKQELENIFESSAEGTEVQSVSLFKLMKAFERVMLRYAKKQEYTHQVFSYNYTTDGVRGEVLELAQRSKTIAFDNIFTHCENRVHAIYTFLSILELVQQKVLNIMIGIGMNDFIIEYINPEDREAEVVAMQQE